MSSEDSGPRRVGGTLYDLILGYAGGVAVGLMAWMVAGMTGATPPLWPFAIPAVVAGVLLTRRSRRSPARRWIHLLWIPYALVVILMFYLMFALKNMT